MAVPPASLTALNAAIVACERCPRLRSYCAEVARTRKRAFADVEYWGRPVPSFGDEEARVLVVGLAPGAHGSNRTGRPFTGDGSGDFLFPTLYETGFASQPKAVSRDDGMKLTGMWINSVVRCAPPANKPTPEELRTCALWLAKKYPEILPLNAQGLALREGARRACCLNSNAYWNASQKIVRAMAESLGQHPALIAWQIDNGLGAHKTESSFNEQTRRDWHAWLKAKYETVDRLNDCLGLRHWGQLVRDWEETPMPMTAPTSGTDLGIGP